MTASLRLLLLWLPLAAVASAVKAAVGPDEPSAATISPEQLDRITVIGRRLNLLGEAISASQGSVGQEEIGLRPLLRTGDLLEFVPGLVATQHSGSGKANQYFLRGFNLDHGTDFATWIDGMPVNMRTHGHGQGWTDLNFLIPELVEELRYRKGPYHAEVGDFSSAGSAHFRIADRLPASLLEFGAGEYGYVRSLLAGSLDSGSGSWLYALEGQVFDGPWRDLDEDVEKTNLVLRYSDELAGGRAHLMLMAYDNRWNSADQIPQRAVDSGLIDRFGSIDTSVGGESSRYSLSAGWQGPGPAGSELNLGLYTIDSDLQLYSNFTYLLEDPEQGDQFEQLDRRRLHGFDLSSRWDAGNSRWQVGLDGRLDNIDDVGLFRSQARRRIGTIRLDSVREGSLGLFAMHEAQLSDRLRSHLGLRHDRYDFEVDARSLPANSGQASDDISSWKASLILAANERLELYGSFGQGFHSNDARGTTIRVDPLSGEPVDPVDPLVASRGAELGARLHLDQRLQATAALWSLRLDSELLFVGDAGDAGGTEASRPSRREGLELGLYWFAGERWQADLELALTRARFSDADPAGREIPGSIPRVLSAGIGYQDPRGWLASARLRHFGTYPLIEDDSASADSATLLNLRLGREWLGWAVHLDLLNALDSDDNDIEYFYASRLPGEPVEGIEDIHFHAFQPRSLRLTFGRQW